MQSVVTTCRRGMMAATDFSAAAIPTCQNLGMAARPLLGAAAQRHHAGTGGQQQGRGHGERHRRGTRLAQAARLGGIHLAVRARRPPASAARQARQPPGRESRPRRRRPSSQRRRRPRTRPSRPPAITSFRAVLSAGLTVISKDFAKSVPLKRYRHRDLAGCSERLRWINRLTG